MQQRKGQQELASLVEQRRKELSERGDVSAVMRELSASGASHRRPDNTWKRPRPLVLALAAVGVLGVIVCVFLVGLTLAGSIWVQNSLGDSSSTVTNYYSDLKVQDYASAYAYFSNSAKAALPESSFASTFSGYDRINGSLQSFDITQTVAAPNGEETVTVDVIRRGATDVAEIEVLQMVKENGNWRISDITRKGTTPATPPVGN